MKTSWTPNELIGKAVSCGICAASVEDSLTGYVWLPVEEDQTTKASVNPVRLFNTLHNNPNHDAGNGEWRRDLAMRQHPLSVVPNFCAKRLDFCIQRDTISALVARCAH